VYLTEANILGEGVSVFWTDLTRHFPDREDDIFDVQSQLVRTSKYKSTLVIEPIGTFFQLIDPANLPDGFCMSDQLFK